MISMLVMLFMNLYAKILGSRWVIQLINAMIPRYNFFFSDYTMIRTFKQCGQ